MTVVPTIQKPAHRFALQIMKEVNQEVSDLILALG